MLCGAYCVVGGDGAWIVAVQVFVKVLYLQGFGVGTGGETVQKWFPILWGKAATKEGFDTNSTN